MAGQVYPEAISFTLSSTQTIRICNISQNLYSFKVKSNASECFTVVPPNGQVKAKEEVEIAIKKISDIKENKEIQFRVYYTTGDSPEKAIPVKVVNTIKPSLPKPSIEKSKLRSIGPLILGFSIFVGIIMLNREASTIDLVKVIGSFLIGLVTFILQVAVLSPKLLPGKFLEPIAEIFEDRKGFILFPFCILMLILKQAL